MEVNDFTSTVACFMRLSWAAAAGRLDLVGSSQPIKESNSLFPAGIRNRLSSSGKLTVSLNQPEESIWLMFNWSRICWSWTQWSSWVPSNSGYYTIEWHKSEQNAVHSYGIWRSFWNCRELTRSWKHLKNVMEYSTCSSLNAGSNCSSGSEGEPTALHAGICVQQQSVSTKDALIAGEALSLLVTCLQLRSQQLGMK